MAGKIFSIEMIVSNVDLIKLPDDACRNLETCVLLRLFDNIEMEVCGRDFGSLGNLKALSNRENCIFSLSNTWDVTSVNSSINVFKKDERDQRCFIGRYDFHLEEIFKKLLDNQDMEKSIITHQSTETFKHQTNPSAISTLFNVPSAIASSVKSLKSESINTNPCQNRYESRSETINGLFPLFNHDDDNIGFILLTLRISCYGNVIMQGKLATQESYTSNKIERKVGSTPDIYQLCSYKNSKNVDSSSDSSCTCICDNNSSVKEKFSDETLKSSLAQCHPPTPVDSCILRPEDDYNEYIQEINGNSLVIRIPKGANMKATVLEPDVENFGMKDVIAYSRNADNITVDIGNDNQRQSIANPCAAWEHRPCSCSRPKNCNKLPIIKGNLKYPNKIDPNHNLHVDIRSSSVKDLIKCHENRNFCMQTCVYDIKTENGGPLHMNKIMHQSEKKSNDLNSQEGKRFCVDRSNINLQNNNDDFEILKKQCPKGIEVCQRKSHDPDTDVYILKLGKKKPGIGNIEVELRTPKCKTLDSNPTNNTVEVQVIEEEFEDYKSYEVGKKDPDEDKIKGGKKKSKGKKGKGKKK